METALPCCCTTALTTQRSMALAKGDPSHCLLNTCEHVITVMLYKLQKTAQKQCKELVGQILNDVNLHKRKLE